MNGKMTAAVLYGKEDLKIEKVPIPRVGDGEVLVKVQVALTCGTDLKVVQEGIPDVIPVEACYLGWQESLTLLTQLAEPEIPD